MFTPLGELIFIIAFGPHPPIVPNRLLLGGIEQIAIAIIWRNLVGLSPALAHDVVVDQQVIVLFSGRG